MLHKFLRTYVQVIHRSSPSKEKIVKETNVDTLRKHLLYLLGYSGILTIALLVTGKFLIF
jgi:hypothetical protein